MDQGPERHERAATGAGPTRTRPSFTDGWFHTGDIGYLDADGYLYLVDRAKDMIIRAGENVYCVEVENVLFDHPDVIDAAVVGVPHKTLGEEVKAVVQLRDGLDGDRRRHPRVLRASISPTSRCRSTSRSAHEPLPRNPAGKVLKNLLRGERRRRSPTGRRPGALAGTDRARAVRLPPGLGLRRDRRQRLAGLYALAAWRWKRLRGRWLWIADDRRRGGDDAAGAPRRVARVACEDFEPPRFHMFYGFVAFITVGLLYSYRYVWKARGWLELAYGLGGLFIMGLGHPRRPPGG